MAAECQMGSVSGLRGRLCSKSVTLITRSIFIVELFGAYKWIEETVCNRSISKALHKVVVLQHDFPWCSHADHCVISLAARLTAPVRPSKSSRPGIRRVS